MTPEQIWDELDNYVEQVGKDAVLESKWLVHMIQELHEIEDKDVGRIAVHVDSWLAKGGRLGKGGNSPVPV